MSNEAAREIISTAADLLGRAVNLIDEEKQTFIYQFPIKRCPNSILQKWLDERGHDSANVLGFLEVRKELEARKKFNIKIEEVL